MRIENLRDYNAMVSRIDNARFTMNKPDINKELQTL